MHSLVIRVLHNRLLIASGLAGHTLYLECHHPSARLTASKIFCTSLGTDGLNELICESLKEQGHVGRLNRLGGLYSRFRPQRKEPEIRVIYPHPAGDVPGSRTYRSPDASDVSALDPSNSVKTDITVDAHDLFSQLTTLAYLGKRELTRGLLFSIQEVSEGTIRVWRDWLAKHCETKSWTDGEPIVVRHETPSNPVGQGKGRSDSVTGYAVPMQDPNVLWINTSGNDVGIKFRVKERLRRPNAPLLFMNDVEVSVSYVVEFEEVYIRTMHLLFTLEEAQKQIDNQTGKAIVFGAFRGG